MNENRIRYSLRLPLRGIYNEKIPKVILDKLTVERICRSAGTDVSYITEEKCEVNLSKSNEWRQGLGTSGMFMPPYFRSYLQNVI